MKLFWYDGIQRPPSPEGHDLNKWGIGVLFVGDKGKLLADYGRQILLPESQVQGLQAGRAVDRPVAGPLRGMDPRLQDGRADAVQLRLLRHAGREQPAGHGGVPRAARSSSGTPTTLKATNCPEADKYIRREYRAGWSL